MWRLAPGSIPYRNLSIQAKLAGLCPYPLTDEEKDFIVGRINQVHEVNLASMSNEGNHPLIRIDDDGGFHLGTGTEVLMDGPTYARLSKGLGKKAGRGRR